MYAYSEPHQSGHLAVSDLHQIYYEVSGKPDGIPVILLHGGPGAGTRPQHRGFFNPDVYRIVLIDQRGAGRSLPYACIEENTTWDLVADIEKVRGFLGIKQWLVFGGSWGSTLSLAYAQSHPERVLGLVLRGVWLARSHEYDWLYRYGANTVFPEYWPDFAHWIPEAERADLVAAYCRRLSPDNPNRAEMIEAASRWAAWEDRLITLEPPSDNAVQQLGSGEAALAVARIENHYFTHRCWLESHALLDNIDRIRHLPTIIVQGRYDMCTPPHSAYDLKVAFPEADLRMVHGGHSAFEPEVARTLVAATDEMAERLRGFQTA